MISVDEKGSFKVTEMEARIVSLFLLRSLLEGVQGGCKGLIVTNTNRQAIANAFIDAIHTIENALKRDIKEREFNAKMDAEENQSTPS